MAFWKIPQTRFFLSFARNLLNGDSRIFRHWGRGSQTSQCLSNYTVSPCINSMKTIWKHDSSPSKSSNQRRNGDEKCWWRYPFSIHSVSMIHLAQPWVKSLWIPLPVQGSSGLAESCRQARFRPDVMEVMSALHPQNVGIFWGGFQGHRKSMEIWDWKMDLGSDLGVFSSPLDPNSGNSWIESKLIHRWKAASIAKSSWGARVGIKWHMPGCPKSLFEFKEPLMLDSHSHSPHWIPIGFPNRIPMDDPSSDNPRYMGSIWFQPVTTDHIM